MQSNITSALILEDDADWDVRLKAQMQQFAQAATAFTVPVEGQTRAEQCRVLPGSPELSLAHDISDLPLPTLTPYGDDWDVLWLGHCGTEFPAATTTPDRPPHLRVVIDNDATVPPAKHLKPHPFALQDALGERYPPHTRVVHAAAGTACTQAYAVSQQGARRLLARFGLRTLTAGWDLMLRDWCDGLYASAKVADGGREKVPVCVTVQPPLFSHHYGTGSASDIVAPGGGFVNLDKEMTPYVRVSVRLNMGRLVEGLEGREQWEEEAASPTKGV